MLHHMYSLTEKKSTHVLIGISQKRHQLHKHRGTVLGTVCRCRRRTVGRRRARGRPASRHRGRWASPSGCWAATPTLTPNESLPPLIAAEYRPGMSSGCRQRAILCLWRMGRAAPENGLVILTWKENEMLLLSTKQPLQELSFVANFCESLEAKIWTRFERNSL